MSQGCVQRNVLMPKLLIIFAGILLCLSSPAFGKNQANSHQESLIEEGEKLFFEETFAGNGRTCGTCHPKENNFTIDPAWIATLPDDDPLFVSEFTPGLEALENDRLLREFGLILENVDGMEDPTVKFVMRGVPHTLALSTSTRSDRTEPPLNNTGWSGDGAPGTGTLREFLIGAIIQHYTKSLNRVEDVDFRLPTEEELDAMEAFLLSLGRQKDLDLETLHLKGRLASRGLTLFLREDTEQGKKPAGKCNLCHFNAGATPKISPGISQNFNIGIENIDHPARHIGESMPHDGGFGKTYNPATDDFGNGTFKTSPLVEAADTAPFYHHNGINTLFDAINFYTKDEFANSPSGKFLASQDSGGIAIQLEERDVQAIEAFLRVINALENIREAMESQRKAQAKRYKNRVQELLVVASEELQDAIRVLADLSLHSRAVTLLKQAVKLTEQALDTTKDHKRNELLTLALTKEQEARGHMVKDSDETESTHRKE